MDNGSNNVNPKEPSEIFAGLRNMILTTDPITLHSSIAMENRVFGVLMETGFKGNVTVTLVCIADGTVSLYFSNGGGYIGLGPRKRIRNASDAFIAEAPEYLSTAIKVQEYPLPKEGYTNFYLLTINGVFLIEGKENDLGRSKVPLSAFFHKGQDVITQIRLNEQAEKSMLGAAARGEIENIKKAAEYEILLVNCRDKTGLTPLMAAAFKGFDEAVRLLIVLGAKIDPKDSSGETALMFASNKGNTKCVKVLLELGANVNEQANDGSTAIMYAAQHGHNETIKVLLEHKADPRSVGKHGLSAIGFARQNKLPETEKILNSYN